MQMLALFVHYFVLYTSDGLFLLMDLNTMILRKRKKKGNEDTFKLDR